MAADTDTALIWHGDRAQTYAWARNPTLDELLGLATAVLGWGKGTYLAANVPWALRWRQDVRGGALAALLTDDARSTVVYAWHRISAARRDKLPHVDVPCDNAYQRMLIHTLCRCWRLPHRRLDTHTRMAARCLCCRYVRTEPYAIRVLTAPDADAVLREEDATPLRTHEHSKPYDPDALVEVLDDGDTRDSQRWGRVKR